MSICVKVCLSGRVPVAHAREQRLVDLALGGLQLLQGRRQRRQGVRLPC